MGVVAVGDERHLRADDLPCRFDDVEVELVDLDRGDLGVQRLGDARRDLGRVVVAVEARHHRHAASAARRPASRRASGRQPCRQFPKRHVDGGQGIEIGSRSGRTTRGEAALRHSGARVCSTDLPRKSGAMASPIAAIRLLLHGRPQAQALAIADQPGAGRHLAKDEMQRVGRAGRFGNPQSDRVYAFDDHGRRVNAGDAALASICTLSLRPPSRRKERP